MKPDESAEFHSPDDFQLNFGRICSQMDRDELLEFGEIAKAVAIRREVDGSEVRGGGIVDVLLCHWHQVGMRKRVPTMS